MGNCISQSGQIAGHSPSSVVSAPRERQGVSSRPEAAILVDRICSIAKEGTLDQLQDILATACIDVAFQGESAIQRLAKEGDTNACNFLLSAGASISKAAEGAAQGGDIEYAEMLRTMFNADVSKIALGAALGGNREYAETLRTGHNADVSKIALGAALGGHREYAETLRTRHNAAVDLVAFGASGGGDRDYAQTLLTRHNADVNIIAQGAAQGGHMGHAEALRTTRNADVVSIALGAALGGHRDYAEMLRTTHNVDVNWVARGAARGGHVEYTEVLRTRHNADVNSIAESAAQGGYRDYAETLRVSHNADVSRIAQGAVVGGYEDYADFLARLMQANALEHDSAAQTNQDQLTNIDDVINKLSDKNADVVTSIVDAAPDHYRCPLSLELYRDPVILSDGFTYERRFATEWLSQHNTSPMNRSEVSPNIVIPNRALSESITAYLQHKFDKQGVKP